MNNDELNGSAPVGLYELADGAPIADGGLVCLDGNGKAVPGGDAAGLKFVGVAEGSRDGLVKVGCGIVRLPHAGLTRVMRGDPAYAKDSSTVANATENKVACGIVVDVDADGAWIDTRPQAVAAARVAAGSGL